VWFYANLKNWIQIHRRNKKMKIPKSKMVTIEVPIGVFSALKQTTEEFAISLRIAAAVKWYERGMVSQGKAAEIAGLCREDFIMALGQFELSPFQYSAKEVLREAGYETELGI
jgi:predicted HTH domain antitoxin